MYIRVSSIEQVGNYSLDDQEKACRNEAERRDYEVLKVFREEGKSAKTANRPKLIELLEFCRKNKDKVMAVLVYKIDRMSRNTLDFLVIKAKLSEFGIQLLSVSEPTEDNPAGKLLETMLAGFANFDNDVRAERARNGSHSRFLDGWKIGRAPSGYKNVTVDDKDIIVPDEPNFSKFQKVWEIMGTGTKTLRDVSDIANNMGLRIKGKKIRSQALSRIFSNKFYMGILVSPKYREEIQGKHTPMVSESLYYKIRSILTGRTVAPLSVKHSHDHEDFPLRRIVKCPCGLGFTGGWSKGRTKSYAYYRPSCKTCRRVSILNTDLENSLVELLRNIAPTKEMVDLFILRLHINYNRKLSKLKEIHSKTEKRITEIKQERILIAEKNAKGIFADDIYKEMDQRYESEMIAVQTVANEKLIEKYDIESVTSFIKALLNDLGKAYLISSLPQKKTLLGSIFPQGLVFEKGHWLNPQINPNFRTIQEVCTSTVPLGAG